MPWEYHVRSRTYVETSSGERVTPARMVALRDEFVSRLKTQSAALASDVAQQRIGIAEWEARMRGLTKVAHVDLAVAGRGGRDMMRPADWGRVGRELRRQYQYLGGFADALPTLTEGQIAARAGMYVASGTVSFERAAAKSAGGPELPEYPGDGSQQCGSNCRCAWEIEQSEDGWDCTWVANDDQGTCEDCARNGDTWAPLFVGRELLEMPDLDESVAPALAAEVA